MTSSAFMTDCGEDPVNKETIDLKREESANNVAGSSSTNILGRSTVTHSAEGVSVRKRSACDDGGIPSKKKRSSNLTIPTEHSEGPVEDRNIQNHRRQASVDAGPPVKGKRSGINNTGEPRVMEKCCMELNKRKASDDAKAPESKRRCGTNSSHEVNMDSEEDENEISSSLTEEERIFKLSSIQNLSKAKYKDKYCEIFPLGNGGYGSVYAGFRKSDSLPVAIKHIRSDHVRCHRVTCNGKVFDIIIEVALMLKAAGLHGSVGQSAAVSLLDWYFLRKELILVMERPSQSMDLDKYLESRGGFLDEQEAKVILKQLVDAAIDMHSKGVFHRDIKLANVLIQLDSDVPRVRIIDFGCGTFSKDESYSHLCGTRAFFPPEWFNERLYWAHPTTVWQLGAVFYTLLTGKMFFIWDFLERRVNFNRQLSSEAKILLYMCLITNPSLRVTLEELRLNPALRQS